MSKSDPSEQSRISLTDDADAIALKLRRAKSDSLMGITYDPEARPEASNLLTIYAALSGRSRADVQAEFGETPFSDFKTRLADLAVEVLAPINAEMRRLMADPGHLDRVLLEGAERAEAIAGPVLREVYDVVGFMGRG
jgi:tryptophanyl-tRNA synthetase